MPAKYVVDDVPLIPQDRSMACWYASAQMLIQWRRNQRQMTEASLPDPSELNDTVRVYRANNGLSLSDMVEFSRLMGLRAVPPMSPTPNALSRWLQDYGPIWTAGTKFTSTSSYGHVVVIVGIAPTGIKIHDPEPVSVGTVTWKPMTWLGQTLSRSGQWDYNFLHFPG